MDSQIKFEVRESEVAHYPWRVFEVVRNDGFVKSTMVRYEAAMAYAAHLNKIIAEAA